MNKVLFKDTLRTISRTNSRFFSIILIVALGISFFTGMHATAPDMLDSVSEYFISSNASDIRIVSSIGFNSSDVEVISSIKGVEGVCGEKFVDGVLSVDGKKVSEIDGSRLSIRAYSLDVNKAVAAAAQNENDRNFINRPQLVKGNWPANQNECLVDESTLSTPDEFKIGSVIKIDGENADISTSLAGSEYTICGIIRTPLYISYQRGNTTVGTGKLGTFVYLPSENFLNDYYSAISVKIAGSDNYDPYSDEYTNFIAPYISYIESISQERIAPRAASLVKEYTEKVAQGEIDYANATVEIENRIAEAENTVNTMLDMVVNGDKNLADYKKQYNEKAKEAETALGDSKVEHSTQYARWEQKRNEYNEAKKLVDQYATAETDYKNAVTQYNIATGQVNTMLATVDYLENLVATYRGAMTELDNSQANSVESIQHRFEVFQSGEYEAIRDEVTDIMASINSLTAVGTAEEMAAYMEPQLQLTEERLASAKVELSNAKSQLAVKKTELDEASQLVEKLKTVRAELSASEIALDEAEKELTNAGYDIQLGELEVISQLSDLKNKITNYEITLQIAKEKKDVLRDEFEEAKALAYEELDRAKGRLTEANNFLLGLDSAKWYVSGRKDALMGFEEYGQTADRTRALSLIFPWFFFLVAALVSLNTMTRMVEDERTQLGTLKAMGLHNSEIVIKYVFYAFVASFIGAFAGSFLGFAVFPTAITACYGILFDVPPITISYRFGYAVIGILISVGLTVLATFVSVYRSLVAHPSVLMKPKAPKGGKRIWLEKFPKLWSKMNFSTKVTFRNVFRNKKRFIMAVIGVMGCTSLLVAGFGLDNSINATIDRQFKNKDKIVAYDMQVILNGSYDTTHTKCGAIETVSGRSEISSAALEYMKICTTTGTKSQKEMETYIYVPENAAALPEYIHIRDVSTKKEIALPQSGCVITQKLAKELNISVGDSITVNLDDGTMIAVPVAGIAENYTFHYMYMTKEIYRHFFGKNPGYNYIVANFSSDVTDEQKAVLTKELMREYEISAVSYSEDIQSMFENTLDSIGYIVIILVVSAALLSIIVLYNLSIININERVKEIATIKVLGFNRGEVNAYIFRENVLLSVFGTLIGLYAGYWVHRLVINVAEVNIIMYGRQVGFLGYLLSAVLSLVFALVVNLILSRKLRQVDMVESLKSNE